MELVFDGIENIAGKRENAGSHYFHLSHYIFDETFFFPFFFFGNGGWGGH